jgi:hypothetical protein
VAQESAGQVDELAAWDDGAEVVEVRVVDVVRPGPGDNVLKQFKRVIYSCSWSILPFTLCSLLEKKY